MNRHYFLWIVLIALGCLLLTIYTLSKSNEVKEAPPQENVISHSHVPFKSYLSAVGVVEASSDNIAIGTSINRIVDQVFVKGGAKVKKGEPLFKLEDQDLQADLKTRQVALEIAQAQLQKLEALPRPEDVAIADAVLKKAEIEKEEARIQYDAIQGLETSKALSLQEINRRKFNYEQASAQLEQAKSNYNKIKEGTWKPDLEIAKLETLQAKSHIQQIDAEIERTIVRSPIDGVVLQVNVHEGELPSAVASKGALMIIGDTDELYLKVSINQFEAPYFSQKAPAIAFLRGNARIKFDLQFVRLEPYLVNKQNLTNDITEKVDTKVLQVIYHIQREDHHTIFVGQQMDVYIEAELK